MIPPIAFHPAYEASLPAGHRFPMRKYGLLAETLIAKGLAPLGFVTPEPATAEILVRAHDPAYVEAVLTCAVPREIERAIGLPVDAALVRRSRASVGGTLLAARLALAEGLAGSAAGGSHHARRSTGGRLLRAERRRGGGAHPAGRRADHGAPSWSISTCTRATAPRIASPCARSCSRSRFTARTTTPLSKIAGDLDIGLPDRLDDGGYLDVLQRAPAARSSTPSRPTSCSTMPASIPTGTTGSGGCASPTTGLLARDRFVVAQARARGIPLVAVIGGGYTHDVEALAQRHALVFEAMAAEAAAGPASA